MRWVRSALLAGAVAVFGFSAACRPSRGNASAPDAGTCSAANGSGKLSQGVASDETWLSLSGFCTRIRVPNGWEWAHKDSMVIGLRSGDGKRLRGGYVLAGSYTEGDVKRLLGRALDEFRLRLGPPTEKKVEGTINGLHVSRQDFQGTVDGRSARAVALIGEPPEGKGFIVFLGFAVEGNESVSEELVDALNSLSRG